MKSLLSNLYWSCIILIATLFVSSCAEDDILLSSNRALNLAEAPSEINAARSIGPWAGGQGWLFIFEGYQNFAFHVRTDKNGNTSGTWEVKSRGQEVRAHGTLDCLGIIAGNEAFMTGEVTLVAENNPLNIVVGDRVYLKVRDNGKGGKNPPDEFTDIYVTAFSCIDVSLPFMPIERGNIRVFSGRN